MVDRVLLAALLLSGLVGSAGAGLPKRDLIVWGDSPGTDAKGDQALLREFERRHPEINLRLLSVGSGGADPQKLMTAIVGGASPDVVVQDRFSLPDWTSRRAFRPLDDLIARDRKTDPQCPKPEQYYPGTWAEACYADGPGSRHVYGIPAGADDRILYYNKAIFARHANDLRLAGLDPDRAPGNWTELLAYARATTEYNPDGTLKVVGFEPDFGNSWLYLYCFQTDASFLSSDGRTCTLDSPNSEEALNFMVEGYDQIGGYQKAKAFESGLLNRENDAFLIGQVAMKIDVNYILDDISRFHPELPFGVAPPPVPDDRVTHRGRYASDKDTYVTWVGGFAYVIPRGAKNVEDAWTFVKFVTSTEGRLIQARGQQEWDHYLGRSYIPTLTPSIEANRVLFARFKPADPKFATALKLHIDLMRVGRIRPVSFAGQILWDNQVRAFETAALHRQSPREALQSGQEAVQAYLDGFYEDAQEPKVDLGMIARMGWGLGAMGLGGILIWFWRRRMGRLARTEALWAYAFITPWLLGFLVFTAGPMLASLLFSFTTYDVLSEARWAGLKNYATMAGSDHVLVWKSLFNAAYLAAFGVPTSILVGLAIAMLLNTATRGVRLYRTFFYMPAIVPGVASAVLWIWVLTPDPNRGLVNAAWQHTIWQWLAIPPPGWLTSADWSKMALVVMGAWGSGSGMILWLAGLKAVPSTLYEASSIDGASPGRQFWSVTLPTLSPVIFFNTVMGFIAALQEFDRVYIMKPPSDGSIGPDDSLMTPAFYLFRNGFGYFHMGYASALAWMLFGIILVLTLAQFKLAPRWVHYESER